MPFSQEVKTRVMVDCGRSCVICHKFCGNNMEVHHIKAEADGGSNDIDNAIPLCFDCHAEVRQYDSRHPKGIKFSEAELKMHRDKWYTKVTDSPAICGAPDYIEMDTVTYHALEYYLPNDRFVTLRDMDFGGENFAFGYFDKVEYFPIFIKNPKYEYLDADLEISKNSLAKSISDFTNDSVHFLHSDDGKIVMIPRDWELTCPEQFDRGVEVLNADSSQIWEKYCDYIKLCRRKLMVDVK